MGVSFSQGEGAVAVVGSGPTGLMLAAELALAGVEPTVLERRPQQELVGSRAGGLHSRAIEILDLRRIAERFLAEGKTHEAALFADAVLDTGDMPSRHPYSLGLFQKHIERILAGWVAELGVSVHYGREVAGFSQDESGVEVKLVDDGSLRAQYLVGCDGGRSVVRRGAGIEFAGWDASLSALIAAVEMAEEPELGLRYSDVRVSGIGPMGEGETLRVVIAEQELNSGEPDLDDLRRALDAVYGTDFDVHSPLRAYSLLNKARPALIDFGDPGEIEIAPWADRVQLVDAAYEGTWELPVLGEVPPPTAVLIRPDGHVAWVGEGTAGGLTEALTTWFGAARPAARG